MNLQLVPDQQRQHEGSCWADFGQDEMKVNADFIHGCIFYINS